MLLERLNYHLDDPLAQCSIDILANSDHNNLDQTAQDKLNVHGLLDALVRIFNGHLQLCQDHLEHLLEAGVALGAARLAQGGQCRVARLYQAIVPVVLGDARRISEKCLSQALKMHRQLVL